MPDRNQNNQPPLENSVAKETSPSTPPNRERTVVIHTDDEPEGVFASDSRAGGNPAADDREPFFDHSINPFAGDRPFDKRYSSQKGVDQESREEQRTTTTFAPRPYMPSEPPARWTPVNQENKELFEDLNQRFDNLRRVDNLAPTPTGSRRSSVNGDGYQEFEADDIKMASLRDWRRESSGSVVSEEGPRHELDPGRVVDRNVPRVAPASFEPSGILHTSGGDYYTNWDPERGLEVTPKRNEERHRDTLLHRGEEDQGFEYDDVSANSRGGEDAPLLGGVPTTKLHHVDKTPYVDTATESVDISRKKRKYDDNESQRGEEDPGFDNERMNSDEEYLINDRKRTSLKLPKNPISDMIKEVSDTVNGLGNRVQDRLRRGDDSLKRLGRNVRNKFSDLAGNIRKRRESSLLKNEEDFDLDHNESISSNGHQTKKDGEAGRRAFQVEDNMHSAEDNNDSRNQLNGNQTDNMNKGGQNSNTPTLETEEVRVPNQEPAVKVADVNAAQPQVNQVPTDQTNTKDEPKKSWWYSYARTRPEDNKAKPENNNDEPAIVSSSSGRAATVMPIDPASAKVEPEKKSTVTKKLLGFFGLDRKQNPEDPEVTNEDRVLVGTTTTDELPIDNPEIEDFYENTKDSGIGSRTASPPPSSSPSPQSATTPVTPPLTATNNQRSQQSSSPLTPADQTNRRSSSRVAPPPPRQQGAPSINNPDFSKIKEIATIALVNDNSDYLGILQNARVIQGDNRVGYKIDYEQFKRFDRALMNLSCEIRDDPDGVEIFNRQQRDYAFGIAQVIGGFWNEHKGIISELFGSTDDPFPGKRGALIAEEILSNHPGLSLKKDERKVLENAAHYFDESKGGKKAGQKYVEAGKKILKAMGVDSKVIDKTEFFEQPWGLEISFDDTDQLGIKEKLGEAMAALRSQKDPKISRVEFKGKDDNLSYSIISRPNENLYVPETPCIFSIKLLDEKCKITVELDKSGGCKLIDFLDVTTNQPIKDLNLRANLINELKGRSLCLGNRETINLYEIVSKEMGVGRVSTPIRSEESVSVKPLGLDRRTAPASPTLTTRYSSGDPDHGLNQGFADLTKQRAANPFDGGQGPSTSSRSEGEQRENNKENHADRILSQRNRGASRGEGERSL